MKDTNLRKDGVLFNSQSDHVLGRTMWDPATVLPNLFFSNSNPSVGVYRVLKMKCVVAPDAGRCSTFWFDDSVPLVN